MNKIVIEVTSNGWETTATINGKEYKEEACCNSIWI